MRVGQLSAVTTSAWLRSQNERGLALALAKVALAITVINAWSVTHQRKHFAPASLVAAKDAHHPAGRHHHAGRSNPARRHAGVAGLDDHRNALGLEFAPDAVGDLRGQPLLDLQTPRKAMQNSG